ncbi:MAG: HAD family hydrolase [Phycisphaerae bacterium]|nr:HAD family hydrolase [Phycisphaerae bacterium]
MVIGLDLDDTITRHPAFFACIASALRAAGHRVLVVTHREDPNDALRTLNDLGVAHDAVICPRPGDRARHGLAWKAAVCREQGVSVMFEDCPETVRNIGPETVCFVPFDPDWHRLEPRVPGG